MSTNMRLAEDRERLFLVGTWLVGLGAVFLIRESAGWDWTQAWPLFVIFLGVAGIITALVTRRHTRSGIWGIWGPVAIVVVGAVLLASTTGSIGIGLRQLASWWPIAAIAIGVWFLIGALFARESTFAVESLAVPVTGLTQAEIRLNFGGGELSVGAAQPDMLLTGSFGGGVLRRDRGPGRIELKPLDATAPFFSAPLHWQVGITSQIPVDLRLESGASRSTIDLSGLRIRRLELHTGASETLVRLPAQGATSVGLHAGVSTVRFEVPAGVSARVRGRLAIGPTTVDETRFPRSFDGWESPDFATATNRVEIDIDGGLGAVRIK